jgi:hypothetical protein
VLGRALMPPKLEIHAAAKFFSNFSSEGNNLRIFANVGSMFIVNWT